MTPWRRSDLAAAAPARPLAELPWSAVDRRRAILVVPVGATEQHGPHLPLGTDTLVAEELGRRLVSGLDGVADAVAAPAVPYGASGEHDGFPGTLSIGQEALEAVLVELVRSADAFPATVLVSAHGGNAAPVARAVARLRSEGRRVLAWSPRQEMLTAAGPGPVDAHAGAVETSVLLALAPELVGPPPVVGESATEPLSRLLPRLRRDGVRSVSPTGVLGDPSSATRGRGQRLLDAMAADLLATVRAWLSSAPAPTAESR